LLAEPPWTASRAGRSGSATRSGWALAVLAAAGVSDVLDGWYARRYHQQSDNGAVIDAVADKIFVLVVAISLLVHGSLSLVDVVLLGTRDVGEIALGAGLALSRPGRLRAPRTANVAGKIATVFQYAAVVAVIVGSAHRTEWIAGAAFAGALASLAYWRAEREATER
jgi:cardiolipin synthase